MSRLEAEQHYGSAAVPPQRCRCQERSGSHYVTAARTSVAGSLFSDGDLAVLVGVGVGFGEASIRADAVAPCTETSTSEAFALLTGRNAVGIPIGDVASIDPGVVAGVALPHVNQRLELHRRACPILTTRPSRGVAALGSHC